MQEHVYQKRVRYVDELKWSATSRASLIDRAIDQWRDYFNACFKAKIKHFEHLL